MGSGFSRKGSLLGKGGWGSLETLPPVKWTWQESHSRSQSRQLHPFQMKDFVWQMPNTFAESLPLRKSFSEWSPWVAGVPLSFPRPRGPEAGCPASQPRTNARELLFPGNLLFEVLGEELMPQPDSYSAAAGGDPRLFPVLGLFSGAIGSSPDVHHLPPPSLPRCSFLSL